MPRHRLVVCIGWQAYRQASYSGWIQGSPTPVPRMGSSSATMSFQPCMTYIRRHVPHVPSVPKDHPHEATGDFGDLGNHPHEATGDLGDLGGLGDPRARSRRWRPAGGLDLIGMSRVRRLPSAKHTYVVV